MLITSKMLLFDSRQLPHFSFRNDDRRKYLHRAGIIKRVPRWAAEIRFGGAFAELFKRINSKRILLHVPVREGRCSRRVPPAGV